MQYLFHHFFSVLSQGDLVFLSRENPVKEEKMMIATVHAISKVGFTLSSSEAPPVDIRDGVWRLDKATNQIQFDRLCDALEGSCIFFY